MLCASALAGCSAWEFSGRTWHSTYDLRTEIRNPVGELQQMSYDGSKNVSWVQDGRGSASRTNFTYDGANRLEYVQPPGHSSGERTRMEYDSYLGNLQRTTSPIGFVSEVVRDSMGRVVKQYSPTDSAQTSTMRVLTSITYDGLNRPTQIDRGPVPSGATPTYSFATISGYAYDGALRTTYTYSSFGCGRGSLAAGRAGAGPRPSAPKGLPHRRQRHRLQCMSENPMTEILFIVEEAPEGGYTARSVGASIFTEADDMAQLREAVRDAVRCHFEDDLRPRAIRLHLVRDEVIAA